MSDGDEQEESDHPGSRRGMATRNEAVLTVDVSWRRKNSRSSPLLLKKDLTQRALVLALAPDELGVARLLPISTYRDLNKSRLKGDDKVTIPK